MSDLTTTSALKLRQLMTDRQVSSVEVMTAFLDQIDATNPSLNAIVSLRDREELLAEAHAADNSAPKGPLHGLPMAPKDLSETAGLRTTHGSPVFADNIPDKDSQMAERLRAAGAIFVGKSNTPEFGLGSHTYNQVFGVTRNPYDHGKTAGGSSGGAAVALAARMLPIADGSDMMGSLRNPAGWNNVYGFRPSYGMVPQEPRGDSFHTQMSTTGPMARTPADLRLLLDVLSAPSKFTPHVGPIQRPLPKTIRWMGDWNGQLPFEDGVLDLCQSALDVFDGGPVHVENGVPAMDRDQMWKSWIDLRSWIVGAGIIDLYENPATRERIKPEALWEIERAKAMSALEVSAASSIRSEWFREVEQTDCLWAIPSAQLFPFDAGIDWPSTVAGVQMDTYHRWMECVVPASLIGAPAICLPAGFKDGLPIGVQVFGPRGTDHALIELAQSYHDVTNWPDKMPIASV